MSPLHALFLYLSQSPIDHVFSYKFPWTNLYIYFSWGKHILFIIKKAGKVLELIYRNFYRHSSYTETLLHLLDSS